jgi:hypothetical protein
MFYKKYLIIFPFLLLLACKNNKKNAESNNNGNYTTYTEGVTQDTPHVTESMTVTPKTTTAKENFTLVPKVHVGLITASMTEGDIKNVYGAENVARVDRGSVKNTVYPNTPDEIEISWKKGMDYKKLETIIIRRGKWKTAEGIGIGTTIEQLNTINGKPVELYQLEDDYAIVRWKEGRVNPNLKVIVDTYDKKVTEIQIDF